MSRPNKGGGMDIRQIRAFLAIADSGSVTKAAEALHLVQPAVSRQLKLLEEELGVPLFERNRSGMCLTPEGEILKVRAARALRELDSARVEIKPSGAITGHVNVGLLPSSCEVIATPLTVKLKKLHPGIHLSLSVGFTDHLMQWVDSGELDAALLYNVRPNPALHSVPLLQEPLWLCGAPSICPPIEFKDGLQALGDFPIILPSRQHGLRSLVERVCSISRIPLKVAADTNSLSVHKDLLVNGVGISILPKVAIGPELSNGRLWAMPITHPEFIRRIELALPSVKRPTPAVAAVTGVLQKVMAEAVEANIWFDAIWIGK